MALPTMPAGYRWFRGGPGLSRAGRNALFAADDTQVWVWDEETDQPVTDTLVWDGVDGSTATPGTPKLDEGWVLGAGLPTAVRIASFSLGKGGKRYEMVSVQTLIDASAALAPTDTQVASLVNDTGSATRGAIDPIVAGKVDKGALMLSINDYANTPSAIASVLDQALADAASSKRVVALGPGTWTSSKPGRHQLKSYTGLVGDPSGGTVLKFTDPAGGINLSDTAGSDSLHVYGTKLRDLTLDGTTVAQKLLTGSKIEELAISSVRVMGWTDAAVELADASLVNTYRFEAAGTDSTLSLPAVRLAGTTGSVEFASCNFFKCSGVEVAGPALTDIRFTGQCWFEASPDVFTVNHPAAAVAIGRLLLAGRVVNTTTTARLVRFVAAGSNIVNANLIDLRDLNLTANSATTSLIDLSAFSNGGTVMLRFRDSIIQMAALTGQLLAVNASQAWNLVHADFADLWGATPGNLFATARWFPTAGFVTGGAYAKPLLIKGSGSPEGTYTAPVGSLYQRIDSGQLATYRKVSGFGATGWQPMDTFGPVKTVTANYTITYDDSVILANGTGLTITLPTAASYGGRRFTIKNINASTATVAGTVDGAANPTLAQNARITVVTDGAAWRQID